METTVVPRPVRWRFGECVLDGATLELSLRGERVRLEPKPLQTLMFLLRHPGEVVTKDELYEAIWPGRVLSDSVLAKCMARLRQGLADEDQILIKTVHGFGYRLAAPITVETVTSESAALIPDIKAGDEPFGRPGWSLVERLDSGGHGDVWIGEHGKTHECRVFKFGQDAASVAGLRREITLSRVLRESLGTRRDIVRVLGWNLDEEPFFIESEYAQGGSLLRWAETQGGIGKVPVDLRLVLAAQVAEALGAAHSAGVLHRDLKPGNILIALDHQRRPQVQLGDFGSGRMLDFERLRALEITRMGFTQSGQGQDDDPTSGTPLYLAPELLTGGQPTVQSDIYALGVVLYQIVVGDFRRLLAPGWERDVTDELLREDIAAAGAGDPALRLGDAAELGRRLRSLDVRREQRAAALAAATEAASLRVALNKARIRRRRALILAAVFAFALGLSAIALVLVQSARDKAQVAGQRAEREAAAARAVNRFLTDDLLGNASPLQSGERDLRVSQIVQRAEAEVGKRFGSYPEQEAPVRLALGRAHLSLGDYARAEQQLQAAQEIVTADAAAETELAARIDLAIAETYIALDRRDDAEHVLAAVQAKAVPDSDVALISQMHQAWLMNLEAAYDPAIQRLVELRSRFERVFGPDHARVTELLNLSGATYVNAGRYEEGIALLQEAADRIRKRLGDRDARTIEVRISIGIALRNAERMQEALVTLSAVHELARDALGMDHLQTINAASALAAVHQQMGDTRPARLLLERSLERARTALGAEHVATLEMMNNLAKLLTADGDLVRGVTMFEEVFAIRERVLGIEHEETLISAHNLARAYSDSGDWKRAEALQASTYDTARRVLPDHYLVGVIGYSRANSLGQLRRYDEAEALFDESIQQLARTLGEDSSRVTTARKLRDEMRRRRGDKP
ncbi:MAG: tetratricopeptide repeat protein [Panacagrimonas sp.]